MSPFKTFPVGIRAWIPVLFLSAACAAAIAAGHDGRRAWQMMLLALPALLWLCWPVTGPAWRRVRAVVAFAALAGFLVDGALRAFLQVQDRDGKPVPGAFPSHGEERDAAGEPEAAGGSAPTVRARGFPYRAGEECSGTMTCAGVASVAICRDVLRERGSRRLTPARRKRLAWDTSLLCATYRASAPSVQDVVLSHAMERPDRAATAEG